MSNQTAKGFTLGFMYAAQVARDEKHFSNPSRASTRKLSSLSTFSFHFTAPAAGGEFSNVPCLFTVEARVQNSNCDAISTFGERNQTFQRT
jgi:hypothetical protein